MALWRTEEVFLLYSWEHLLITKVNADVFVQLCAISICSNQTNSNYDTWGLYYRAGFSFFKVTSGFTLDFLSNDTGSLLTGINHHGNLCWAADLLRWILDKRSASIQALLPDQSSLLVNGLPILRRCEIVWIVGECSKTTLDTARTSVCVRGGQCTGFYTMTGVMFSQDEDFAILSSLVLHLSYTEDLLSLIQGHSW